MRRLLEITTGLGLAWLASHAAARAAAQPEPSSIPAPASSARAQPPPAHADAPPAHTDPSPAHTDPSPAHPEPPSAQRAARLGVPLDARFDSDAALPQHADPVAGYTLRASLDPVRHIISAEGKIHFRNASRVPQSEVWLHLYLNAFKNDRTYFMRFNPGDFRGAGHLGAYGSITVKRFALGDDDLWPRADKTSPGDPEDETDIRVPLPQPIAPGDAVDIDVAFESHLPALLFRTGHFGAFHMVGQWFPKLARLEEDGRWAHFPFHRLSEFYADFGAYDVTVDTPENVVVGATGSLAGETRAGGRVARRYVQEDVHDFAFAAWDQFRERTVRTEDGVTMRVLYPPGYERDAEVELDTARFGLRHLGEAYGRYPYPTLTLVHPPAGADEAGGMEYPTLITTGGSWFNPWTGALVTDIVTIHELGHQWFYGLVATDEHAWPFLDEGLNSYAETEALEALHPNASAFAMGSLTVGLPAIHRYGGADARANAPVAQAASEFASGGDYGSLVYSRTATVLLTLGNVYGPDTLRRALGRYARRHRFGHPVPADLIQAVREVVGDDAAAQLRVALFDRGNVDYTVADISSEPDEPARGLGLGPAPTTSGGYRGDIFVRRRGTLRFPVDVEVTEADGTVQRLRWDAVEPAARLPWHGRSRIVSAVINPDHRVLLDDDLSNNARRQDRRSISGALVDRLSFALSTGLSGVLP
ncbi:MAG: M1 family metallopeptidase [Minicystis sp.]